MEAKHLSWRSRQLFNLLRRGVPQNAFAASLISPASFCPQMGGDLEIDSAPGTGIIARLLFPIAEINECPGS